ncbi:hypothetical protein CRG98_033295 [Punica granatum]|uniref:Uncharacterized protein n=1 Tax=Punica granatum TaxID=22663 RepID=A0A2I0IQP6_PUNGR|nr:hypothetical protein CRG98_033295 [Punica granatum]
MKATEKRGEQFVLERNLQECVRSQRQIAGKSSQWRARLGQSDGALVTVLPSVPERCWNGQLGASIYGESQTSLANMDRRRERCITVMEVAL